MSAGLVSYKLCDRGFDCERCPFDAALRGEPLAVPGSPPGDAPRVAALCFPEDRLYGPGHTWVQEMPDQDDARVRVGLDAFAVALIGNARRVEPRDLPTSPEQAGKLLAVGDPLCDLDLLDGGLAHLSVGCPVAGRPLCWNDALAEDGALLVSAPYDDGWIAEIDGGAGSTGHGDGDGDGKGPARHHLESAAAARDRARLDLRRFRRRAALFLFDQTDAVGPTLQDGGEALTDLRFILGPTRFAELVGALVG